MIFRFLLVLKLGCFLGLVLAPLPARSLPPIPPSLHATHANQESSQAKPSPGQPFNELERSVLSGELAPSQANQLGAKPLAQTANLSPKQQRPPIPGFDQRPPSLETLPEQQPLPELPPLDQLLQTPELPSAPGTLPGDVPETIVVTQFNVVGSEVFTPAELAAVTAPYTNRPISFAELFQVRTAITQLYIDAGYVTSGAYIPPQELDGGVVTVQVIEGRLEAINVTGTERLNPDYVRDRIALATTPPLNVNRLLESLQLLQINPLIGNLSAELQAGATPDSSVLLVTVEEADSFNIQLSADNGRSPSVGSFRQQFLLTEGNLFGQGDGFEFSFARTEGSLDLDASYTYPINPRDGTIGFAFGVGSSEIIEPPFDDLDIESDSRYYELTWRQPLILTPNEELAVGVTASRRETRSVFLEDLVGEAYPFPALGTDADGRTRLSVLRLFQEWTQRDEREVLALRSQFSIGTGLFDATPTSSDFGPNAEFFLWRGQGQWVRLLAPDTLLLIRGDMQFADNSLPSLEQFGLGGPLTVRGYRQDALLTDNGMLASVELRVPVLRVPEVDGLLQVMPFFDIGKGWNLQTDDPDPSLIAGLGVGVIWQMGDRLFARLDWGIPLMSVESNDRTWQENGLYFNLAVNF